MDISTQELKDILNHYHDKFNAPEFIENDPIKIPHQFSKKEDIEIAGFLAATIAWGKREMIIKNAERMMLLMDNSPLEFVLNHSNKELLLFDKFVHRTFNGTDLIYFIRSLKNIYTNHIGLENVLSAKKEEQDTKEALVRFNKVFFELEDHPERTKKHVSNPAKGSSSKRLNMYIRWMTRKDNRGVDLGIWNSVSSHQLICPLDVHTGNVSRKLNLLSRKQNDWIAAKELTEKLKLFDTNDPVKYDFALFGAGINQEI